MDRLFCSDRGKPFGRDVDWRTTNDCNLVASLNFNLGDRPAAIAVSSCAGCPNSWPVAAALWPGSWRVAPRARPSRSTPVLPLPTELSGSSSSGSSWDGSGLDCASSSRLWPPKDCPCRGTRSISSHARHGFASGRSSAPAACYGRHRSIAAIRSGLSGAQHDRDRPMPLSRRCARTRPTAAGREIRMRRRAWCGNRAAHARRRSRAGATPG